MIRIEKTCELPLEFLEQASPYGKSDLAAGGWTFPVMLSKSDQLWLAWKDDKPLWAASVQQTSMCSNMPELWVIFTEEFVSRPWRYLRPLKDTFAQLALAFPSMIMGASTCNAGFMKLMGFRPISNLGDYTIYGVR